MKKKIQSELSGKDWLLLQDEVLTIEITEVGPGVFQVWGTAENGNEYDNEYLLVSWEE